MYSQRSGTASYGAVRRRGPNYIGLRSGAGSRYAVHMPSDDFRPAASSAPATRFYPDCTPVSEAGIALAGASENENAVFTCLAAS